MALTEKQEHFCIEIVRTNNRDQAYRSAFDCRRMKQATIDNNAFKLLQRNDIATRIAALREPVIKEAQLSLQRVLDELTCIAYSDIAAIVNSNGTLKPLQEWPKDSSRAVQAVEIHEIYEGTGAQRVCVGAVKKIKFCDKLQATNQLMKHLGGYKVNNFDKEDPLKALYHSISGTSLPVVE